MEHQLTQSLEMRAMLLMNGMMFSLFSSWEFMKVERGHSAADVFGAVSLGDQSQPVGH